MDEIGSKPLVIVDPGAEGLRGASCMGDMPPGPEGGPPGNRGPPGGPPLMWPGLGTGKRLFVESIGGIPPLPLPPGGPGPGPGPPGPLTAPGLGAGNLLDELLGSALLQGGGGILPPGVIRFLSVILFCEGLGTGKFMSLTLFGVLGVLGPVYFGGSGSLFPPIPPVDEGVSGPPPCGPDGVLGPLDISGCGVVEPGIDGDKRP